MLPVSTPGNAIVYGSGRVRLADLMRLGLVMDVAGMGIVWAAVRWLVPAVLELQ